MENTIEISSGAVRVSLRFRGIIVIEYADNCSVTMEIAHQITQAIYKLSGRNKITVLHIPGLFTTHEDGVREYLTAMSRSKRKQAEAIVIRNLQQRIKANFYLRINRPLCPTMLFDSQQDAENWLKTCVSESA